MQHSDRHKGATAWRGLSVTFVAAWTILLAGFLVVAWAGSLEVALLIAVVTLLAALVSRPGFVARAVCGDRVATGEQLNAVAGDPPLAQAMQRLREYNLPPAQQAPQIAKLACLAPRLIKQLLGETHPQLQAALLASLPSDIATALLEMYPEPAQQDLLSRLTAMTGLSPQALKELDDIVGQWLSEIESRITLPFDGEAAAGTLLKGLDGAAESRLLAGLREQQPDRVERIEESMLDVVNIFSAPDSELTLVLNQLSDVSLSALWISSPTALRDRMHALLPDKALPRGGGDCEVTDINNARRELILIARRMLATGELYLGRENHARF